MSGLIKNTELITFSTVSFKILQKMVRRKFKVVRCLGIGHYSIVYEVVSNMKCDKGSVYAMKRMNLGNSKSVRCALRECRILKRIALEDGRPPYIQTLFRSFFIYRTPVFMLSKGSGFDLNDLLTDSRKHLPEQDVVFYAAEIICGLEWLHQRNIVHLDIKPANILLSDMGHVIITDFDRAYQLNLSGSPKSSDFGGTRGYMAPEICSDKEITVKADIWSLGATIAFLVSGPIYPTLDTPDYLRLSKLGRWGLENFFQLSKPLRGFFHSCFRYTPRGRPSTIKVKKLQFFKHLDWKKVAALEMGPPYLPSQLERSIKRQYPNFNSRGKEILKCAYSKQIIRLAKGSHGSIKIEEKAPEIFQSMSAETINAYLKKTFKDFEFINPSIYKRPEC